MIKVTLNEESKQPVKPFPKVIKFTYPSGNETLILVTKDDLGIVLHAIQNSSAINGDCVGETWNMSRVVGNVTDYNKPITLQNL